MSDSRINFQLSSSTIEELQAFSELLNKDINTILKEALEEYFVSEQKKLMEKNLENESAMTNLDFDEFWDGVDI